MENESCCQHKLICYQFNSSSNHNPTKNQCEHIHEYYVQATNKPHGNHQYKCFHHFHPANPEEQQKEMYKRT